MTENKKTTQVKVEKRRYEVVECLDGIGEVRSASGCDKKCIRCNVNSKDCKYN